MADKKKEIIEQLKVSYRMELETVMNYIANSVNLDGVRAEKIKESLAADIAEEMTHAQQLGVIAAEDGACEQYMKIIKLCDGVDYVTQDLCITLMADEEEHRREFMGFLKEYTE